MIVTRTPFRISFFGGGTDYPEYFERHGGAVLATAIDKSLFLSVTKFYSELFDYSIRLAYSKVECVKTLDEVVDYYDKGGLPNKNLDEKMKKLNLKM